MCDGSLAVTTTASVPPLLRIRDVPPRTTLHLRAVVLPDGGERDVFVVAGRITFVEPDDATTVLSDGYLVPGLVDAHAHLALASPAGDAAPDDVRVRASLHAHLDRGVLVVREPGSVSHAAIGVGPDEGLPRVQSGGRFLAPPGRYFPGLARPVEVGALADAVEHEARATGAWAKVIADFRDGDGGITANYPAAELRDAVDRAHEVGARVAVHVMSAAGVEVALEAGVDSLEHGIGLDDDLVAEMAARAITFVPTMTILPLVPRTLQSMQLAPDQLARSIDDVARHRDVVGRAADAGVEILAGTDAGMVAHGIVADEVRNLAAAGLPAAQAIGAASWLARRFLGLPGIEEGAPADLVAYRDDPRADLRTLDAPAVRVLDGRLVGSA